MRSHIRILGWLHVVLGIVDLVIALAILGLFGAVGLLAGAQGEFMGFAITGVIGTIIGGIITLTAIPNFLAGWGLLNHKNWARWLALILGALNFFKFPWGTAVGVYTFVVLLDDDAKAAFGVR